MDRFAFFTLSVYLGLQQTVSICGHRTAEAILILFLPAAVTACPVGWTPSPVSTTCFLVPTERSTSLFRCVDLCEEHGGTPACIGSAAENAIAIANTTTDGLWLGLYQNNKGLGPAKGWDRCVSGDAPNYTNWETRYDHELHNYYESVEPNDYSGHREDCTVSSSQWYGQGKDAVPGPKSGQWHGQPCDVSDLLLCSSWPYGTHEGFPCDYSKPSWSAFFYEWDKASCLCARGNASAAFAGDVAALEATTSYNLAVNRRLNGPILRWQERELRKRVSSAFAAAIVVAMLPTLLLLGQAGWRRLRRGMDNRNAEAALSTPSGGASSAAVKGRLRAARESAAGRRLRVSFVMVQAGWALSAIGLTPWIMETVGQSIFAVVGDLDWWLVPTPFSICLLLLALFSIDARAIRFVSAAYLVGGVVFGSVNVLGAFQRRVDGEATIAPFAQYINIVVAGVFFLSALALVPTLLPGRAACLEAYLRDMQPRQALRRLWTVVRLQFLAFGLFYAIGAGYTWSIYSIYHELSMDHYKYMAVKYSVLGVVFLLCAALSKPRNRGRLHRRLGRLAGRGTEAEEAAAVAALVGGSNPDAALERASTLLRCLPASRLHAADLTDNMAASPAGPTLHARTEPAAMGEVTAFLSHSWSDEKEAPGAKHAVVARWAERRKEATGKEPTLWLVAFLLHPPRRYPACARSR